MTARHQFNFPRRARRKAEGTPRVANWAVIGIFLILAFAAIAAARDFLMPLTLAIMLFFVFTPLRRLARRRGLPDALTAAAITFCMVIFVSVVAYTASGPINAAAQNLPTISVRLSEKFERLQSSMQGLMDAAKQLDNAQIVAPDDDASTIRVEEEADTTLETVVRLTPALIGQVLFTLILMFFMIAAGDLLYLKIVQSFDSMRDKRSAYLALREIEDSLGSYLGTITIINALLGVVIGLAMWAWGMPGAMLFGIGAFLLNFVPYLGAIAGILLSGVVALVVFPGVFTAAMVAGTYLVLTALEGQLITPYFVSRRLQMNVVVVFIAVALWAWLWSVLGMVIAVPVLVVLRILAEHVPGWEKFGNFLASEEPPAIEDEDEEEARDLIEQGAEAEDQAQARAATKALVEPAGQ